MQEAGDAVQISPEATISTEPRIEDATCTVDVARPPEEQPRQDHHDRPRCSELDDH